MRLIFTSYASAMDFNQPRAWLERIEGYTGILEKLAQTHEVTGIERINYEGELKQNGVRYFFINLGRKTSFFPFRLHQMIQRLKPEVVFINGFIFPLQILQLRWKLGSKVKIIIIHQAEKPFSGLKKILQKKADKVVQAYLFVSKEFGEEWIRQGIISDRSKIYEVIHGSSIFRFTDRSVARSGLNITGSPVFLWVGRLDANKDPLIVVKAFSRYQQSNPSAKLFMIYHSEELLTEVKNLIESSSAKNSIQLVSRLPHHELGNWYNSSDFVISSSYYEGGGIAVVEAMSCGCIPILTDIISFRKLTDQGRIGVLFRPGDENDLYRALEKTKSIDIIRESKESLGQFNSEFSFEAIAKKINRILS